jgi:thiol-disulfide isomerase/thioredoxin
VKPFPRLMLFWVMAWSWLTACGASSNQSSDVTPAAKSVGLSDNQATPIRSAQSEVVGYEDGLYPPQDLSLIANTGHPQFIHSYADWCTVCNQNHPIVNALHDEYADRIDFINLNIDVPETLTARERFNIVQRSQYLLTDPQGNEVQRWYGPLNQETVEQVLDDYLAAH